MVESDDAAVVRFEIVHQRDGRFSWELVKVSKLAAQYDAFGTADKVTGTPTFIVRPSLGSGKSTTLVSPSKQQLTAALDG